MMGLGEIQAISRQATRKARSVRQLPYLWDGNRERARLPFLGSYVPKGWKRTEREPLFVDMSGFGQSGEAALTQSQMFAAMTIGKAYALVEHGQFQGHVAEYERR